MNPLTARLIAYALAVLALVGLGSWGGWHFGAGRWESKYTALQAQGLAQRLQAEQVAHQAVQAQLEALKGTLANNQKVSHELELQNAVIAADRDHNRELVRRLFASASRSTPSGGQLPQAGDRPGTASPGPSSGDGPLEGLVTEAATECDLNRAQLDSLIAEVKPQF